MSTPQQVEAEIARTRQELRATVDELSDRLSPRTLAQDAMGQAKVAVDDLKRRVTGEVRGPGDPEPTKAGWAVVGTGAAVALLVVSKIVRKL